jgi:hypothetical protein
MKKSPQEQKLERLLRASKFSACGFMGKDKRNLWEIVDEDASELASAGKTVKQVAKRMRELTDIGKKALGDWVDAGHDLEVSVDDNRGIIPCPWPHHVRCLKRITTVKHILTSIEMRWSDLNVHLIEEHAFFEGKGAPFRIEPRALINLIFRQD